MATGRAALRLYVGGEERDVCATADPCCGMSGSLGTSGPCLVGEKCTGLRRSRAVCAEGAGSCVCGGWMSRLSLTARL